VGKVAAYISVSQLRKAGACVLARVQFRSLFGEFRKVKISTAYEDIRQINDSLLFILDNLLPRDYATECNAERNKQFLSHLKKCRKLRTLTDLHKEETNNKRKQAEIVARYYKKAWKEGRVVYQEAAELAAKSEGAKKMPKKSTQKPKPKPRPKPERYAVS
jgi:hypothetical protein